MADSNNVRICVYGASSDRIGQAFMADARLLGELLAAERWECINGAGAKGLMRAISDGVLDNGGRAIGVIPQFMVDNGWEYKRLTDIVVTIDMHERKSTMARMASGFVALPGGCGTFEELMEVFTWLQLGIITGKPLVVLNTAHYYDHLIAQVRQAASMGFMKQSHDTLWHVASTPQEAIELLRRGLAAGPVEIEPKY